MKNLFINPNSQALRAGWRILIFILIFVIINVSLTVGVRTILGSLKGGGTLWFTLLGISATLAAYISRKYIDKSNLTSLGLKLDRAAALDVISGVINSALVMFAIYITMFFTGLIEFKGFSWWADSVGTNTQFSTAAIPIVLALILKFVIVAWWEELTFRGMILQNILKGMGPIWAVVISTILFGLIHAGNPDATILSTLYIILTTLQLVYAYFKTGQLWLPMGLHLGWNFFQASIFGFSSSGHSSPTMITQIPVGPDWLSGGSFGAEGSILIIPFTIASLFLINWWVGKTRLPKENSFFKFLVTKDTFKIDNKEITKG